MFGEGRKVRGWKEMVKNGGRKAKLMGGNQSAKLGDQSSRSSFSDFKGKMEGKGKRND
jgi:hypothetical protein